MNKRKIFTCMTAAAISAAIALSSVNAAVVEENGAYTFESSGSISITSTTGELTLGVFTIKPHTDSSKTITVKNGYVSLPGLGSKDSCCVEFTPKGPCDIVIQFKSGNAASSRTLALANANGELAAASTVENAESSASLSYNYNGIGEPLYIYSKGSGINVEKLTLYYKSAITKGDADSSTKIDEIDAALILKHITRSKTITDKTLLSAANADNDGNVTVKDAIWVLSNQSSSSQEDPVEPEDNRVQIISVDVPAGATKVTTASELKSALSSKKSEIYIMNDIDYNERIKLQYGSQKLIGVPDSEGNLPVLNFEGMSTSLDAATSDDSVGINIISADNTVKNLVIEFAHDNGILIKGSAARGNLVENCITRYNNDSGLQVSSGACGNTVKNAYSYRNCDVYNLGGNADGFAVKLGAGIATTGNASDFADTANTYINCYAWDNSDDGWDSYDNQNGSTWTYKNVYENCMCWSNGLAAVQTGYADYAKGLTLDEKLPFIRRLKAQLSSSAYSDFVNKYNSGGLGSRSMSDSSYYSALDSLLGVTIATTKGSKNVTDYVADCSQNSNGFKLGSEYTNTSNTNAAAERYLTDCIAFDHSKKGFDKNNSACNIYLKNTLSFDNYMNYQLDGCTAMLWDGVYGWNGTKSDKLPSSAASPQSMSDNTAAETRVRAAADAITQNAAANKPTVTNIYEKLFGE